MITEYTHPSVLAGVASGASWADPTMDPTTIDWAERQAQAVIPFRVVDGRPVNPHAPTGIRYGRNELGHWGEQACADAVVTAVSRGRQWLLLVERADGHGWALPGGYVDPGESALDAAVRELTEETGLHVGPNDPWVRALPARYVPDPRCSDEAWMVTTPTRVDLGQMYRLPAVEGRDDAKRAKWLSATTRGELVIALTTVYDGRLFPAHLPLLAELLG